MRLASFLILTILSFSFLKTCEASSFSGECDSQKVIKGNFSNVHAGGNISQVFNDTHIHSYTHQVQISEEERYVSFMQQALALRDMVIEAGASQNILVLGKTGAGKSTLVTYLTGHSLVTTKGKKVKRGSESRINVEISDGPISATRVPTQEIDKDTNIHYWDCPGFFDTRGEEQEIFNAMAINQLATLSPLKILFCVQYSELENRWDSCMESLERIMSIFPDHRALKNCLSLIITQIDPDIIEEIEEDIYPVTREVELQSQFKPELLDLMKYLLESGCSFFPKPRAGIGTLYDSSIRANILGKISRLPYEDWRTKAQLVIGTKAINFIDRLHDYYNKHLIALIKGNRDSIPSNSAVESIEQFGFKSLNLIKFYQLRTIEESKTKEGFMKDILPLLPHDIRNSIEETSKIFESLTFLKSGIGIDAERFLSALQSINISQHIAILLQNLNPLMLSRFTYENALKSFIDREIDTAINLYREKGNYDQFHALLKRVEEFSKLKNQQSIEYFEYFQRLNELFDCAFLPGTLNSIKALSPYNSIAVDQILNEWKKELNNSIFFTSLTGVVGQSIIFTVIEGIRNEGIEAIQIKLNSLKPEIRSGRKYAETRQYIQRLEKLQKSNQGYGHEELKQELLYMFNYQGLLAEGIKILDHLHLYNPEINLKVDYFSGTLSQISTVAYLSEIEELNELHNAEVERERRRRFAICRIHGTMVEIPESGRIDIKTRKIWLIEGISMYGCGYEGRCALDLEAYGELRPPFMEWNYR